MYRRVAPDPTERVAARSVAAARLAVLIPVAAAGSFNTDVPGRTQAFFLLTGLVAVPWAVVVLFASESGRDSVATSGWAADLLTVFALQALVPSRASLALVLSVAVVVAAGYLVRTVPARTIGAAAVGLTFLAQLVTGKPLGAADLTLYAAIVVTVTIVAERVAADRRRASELAHRLEGRAAAILDKVADAVVLTGGDGAVRSLNPAAHRLFGTPPRPFAHCSEVLGLHLGERALDCTGGCPLLVAATDQAGVRVWRALPDGRRQPLLAAAALVGSDGTAEVVHSLRDITKLVEADEAKTLFLATTSHELKTPLTVITGFASTMVRRPDLDPETRQAAAAAIHRRALELSRIVDRLLMSSRIEAGRLNLTLTDVDVATLVTDRVAAVRAATDRDVAAAVDVVPPAQANADAVATVVDHLVDNALKYAPEGRVAVAVSLRDGAVELRVSDDGVGMDAEQAEHCFDKFWQADASDARRFGGTGIGLYIVRSLVEAMNGTITVRSALGEGTEFTVRLATVGAEPVASMAGAPVPVPEPRAGEASMIREFMRQIGVADGGGPR
jgi:signal transduction histidine kinase